MVEDERRVDAAEIGDLVSRWPRYQAMRVDPDAVRAWLDQFPDPAAERLAFTVLQALDVVSRADLQDRLRQAHGTARRGVRIDADQRTRREFAVVYASERPAGSSVAKHYAAANKIHSSCVASFDQLARRIDKAGFQRVVVVDDLLDTGASASAQLSRHGDLLARSAEATGREVVLAVASGFPEGIDAVQRVISELDAPVELAVGRPLSARDRCFADESSAFDRVEDRLAAGQLFASLADRHGIERDGDAMLVFEHDCPAGAPSLLWAHGDGWTPLFRRMPGR